MKLKVCEVNLHKHINYKLLTKNWWLIPSNYKQTMLFLLVAL